MTLQRLACVVGLSAVSAWAMQSALATLELPKASFDRAVTDYLLKSSHHSSLQREAVGMSAGLRAFLALNDQARAGVVRELGLAAKAVVMSPATAAAYDNYVKTSQNAVNHGIAVNNAAGSVNDALKSGNMKAVEDAQSRMMRESFQRGVSQRLPSIAKYDAAMIGLMANTDASMMDMSMPKTAAEKASIVKAKAMLDEAKTQAGSDIAKARETHKSALMLAAGLGSEQEAKASEAEKLRQEQQANYNRVLLKPNLKKKLLEFVALAKTVDHKAVTQPKDGKQVFVNPVHERRDNLWKMLYRLGPGGTAAAIAVAQGWAAEL